MDTHKAVDAGNSLPQASNLMVHLKRVGDGKTNMMEEGKTKVQLQQTYFKKGLFIAEEEHFQPSRSSLFQIDMKILISQWLIGREMFRIIAGDLLGYEEESHDALRKRQHKDTDKEETYRSKSMENYQDKKLDKAVP